MPDELQVQQQHDEILESGNTPEEVCGGSPELRQEVRQRWKRMRLLEAELEVLFPTSGPGSDNINPVPSSAGAALP